MAAIGKDSIGKSKRAFINANIYTGGENGDRAQAIVINGGKFVFVGSNEEVKSWVDQNTEVIDLGGRAVLPSFFEAHCHAQVMASLMFSVNLSESKSLKAYINLVESFIQENPENQFVTGNGWDNSLFPPEGPRKEDLDAVNSDIPIALWSIDHHSLWVNSKSLELAGIKKDTPNPPGGVIEKDQQGEPTGTLRESAANTVMDVIPDFTVEQYKIGILEYQKMANALGFTGCFDAMLETGNHAIQAYMELASAGELSMRIRGCYGADPNKGLAQVEDFIEARKENQRGELFQINTIKFFEDGVTEGLTAYLTEPYSEGAEKENDFKSEPIWKKEELGRIFEEVEKNNFRIHVHSIGDAATMDTLDAFEYASEKNGKTHCRHAITHLQLVRDIDISRFKQLGIIAVVNPYWFMRDDYYYNLQIPYLGRERAEKMYPMKSFIDMGVCVASASDFPITYPLNPFAGIETGITRTTPDPLLLSVCSDPDDPKYKEALWPEEKASLRNMIDSFTYNAAYANGLEEITGSIEVGKSADLIVLDRDIFHTAESRLYEIKVILTLFEGETVYKDDPFPV